MLAGVCALARGRRLLGDGAGAGRPHSERLTYSSPTAAPGVLFWRDESLGDDLIGPSLHTAVVHVLVDVRVGDGMADASDHG